MSSLQPMLPSAPVPKTLDYLPVEDAPKWMVGKWPDLTEAFKLRADEIVAWHTALAGQGRPWLVCRRIFNIAPMYGSGITPDDIKAWTWKELAEANGVSVEKLKEDLKAAVEFWEKIKRANSVARAVPQSSPADEATAAGSVPTGEVKPLDGIADFQIHQDFTEDQITAILTPLRFNSIRSSADRLYAANRILELKKQLTDKHTRESARQLINTELNMSTHEMTLHLLKGRLETLQRTRDLTDSQSAEVRRTAEAITAAEAALAKLSASYAKIAAEIGGEELEEGEQKRVAIGTISHLSEAHRQYYASGERLLIDGMFTAAEVVWLTTPLAIRPAQYRPDVVLRVREAFEPENLWDANYKPGVIPREACRRMLKLSQGLTEEEDPGIVEGIDDAVSSPDDSDDPSMASSALDHDPESFIPVLAAPTTDYGAPAPREPEQFMAVSQ